METSRIIDGNLELTKTGDSVITSMAREEVVNKRADAQTKVDHLRLDLTEAEAVVAKWDKYLIAIDE